MSAEKCSPEWHSDEACPRAALDQHLDGAVGELEQLQDGGERADVVDVLEARVIDVRLLLGHQQDLLAGTHRDVQGQDRLLPADEQRDDHVRIDHHVTQRQDGYALADLRVVFRHLALHHPWIDQDIFPGALPRAGAAARDRGRCQDRPDPVRRRSSSTASSGLAVSSDS